MSNDFAWEDCENTKGISAFLDHIEKLSLSLLNRLSDFLPGQTDDQEDFTLQFSQLKINDDS